MSEKRKLSPSGPALHPTQVKRPRQASSCLLSLSDELLLEILHHLPSVSDLLNVCDTCHRLDKVGHDAQLWVHVDTRNDNEVNSLRQLRKLLHRLHRKTRFLAIKGHVGRHVLKESLSPSVLKYLADSCPNLEELILSECYINASNVQISSFPPSLKTLRMPRCEVVNVSKSESYFKDMDKTLGSLKVLDLSDCGWMDNYSLMAITKCQQLEEVVLKGCFRIGECFAYTALSCRFGFRKVKKVDIRDTNAGNNDIPCYGRLPEITHLYMGKTRSHAIERSAESEGDGVITDRGLMTFIGLQGDSHVSKLTHLGLAYTDVTDSILPCLAKRLKLDWIDVTGTKATLAGIQEIVKIRPNCTVVAESLQ